MHSSGRTILALACAAAFSHGGGHAIAAQPTDMRVLRKLVRAAFHTFALYDCDARRYGTSTDYDFPRPPRLHAGGESTSDERRERAGNA